MASQNPDRRFESVVAPPMQPPVQPYSYSRPSGNQPLPPIQPLGQAATAPASNPVPFAPQPSSTAYNYTAPAAAVTSSGYQLPPRPGAASATYNYNTSSSSYQPAPQQNYNLQYQQQPSAYQQQPSAYQQQPSAYQQQPSAYQPAPQQPYPAYVGYPGATDSSAPPNDLSYSPISVQQPADLPASYSGGDWTRTDYQPEHRSDDRYAHIPPSPQYPYNPQPEHQNGSPPRPSTPRPQPAEGPATHGTGLSEEQAISKAHPLSRVYVQDGTLKSAFVTADDLRKYLQLYPEADNDHGCRVFRYGPGCSTKLLMPLFERLDFARFSQYPYGLLGNSSISDAWGSGSCTCDKCGKGQFCGHYMLHKNFNFYLALESDTSEIPYQTPTISTGQGVTSICFGTSRFDFQHADWNIQIFRFRSLNFATTLFAYDALIYQNYDLDVKVRSSPLDYIFHQLEYMLENWDHILQASSQFLTSFRVEVLEERLGTDRSIVRTLIIAAQHWEEYRKVLKTQLLRVDFLRKVYGDPRWAEDREAQYETMATADNLVQRFENIDFRITTELMQETDALIQRVTNLISIDEGYRSRDQNESIRRLTWITFIFLPLLFTSALFSMQVDVFSTVSPWQYYIYTSLVLMFLIFVGYALLRSRRRVARALGKLIASPLRLLIIFGRAFMRSYEANRQMKAAEIDIEKQQKASADEAAVILKWAASSNNLEAIRSLFESGHNGVKASPQACGAALVAAIQSKHIEASMLIMKQKQCLLYVDENGATPLHWAAKAGYANICHELLAGGIPINARDAAGETPLEWAMSEGEESTINLLLRGDKPLNRAETMNLQSIHFSARMGELDMVKSLFEKTGTLEMRDEKGQTVLFHAVKGRQLKVVKWLLEEGRLEGRRSNVSAVDKEGLTALHVAAQAGDRAIAKLLIQRGANVNAESNSLMRPIHMVQGEKGKEMIKLLVQHRAKIDAETKDGTRLIHMAARAGDEGTKILETLVDEGCDIQARAAGGNTAAHLAASCAGTANIAFLVRRSKELLTSRNDMGYTPLMVAAQAGATRVMEYLLDQGASYAVSDNDGRSLVDLTVGWGNHNVMSVLIAHGVKYDTATDNTTWHPIWGAVRDGQGRLTVEQLLGAGVNVDYRWKDMSLLQNALECGNTEAAKCLLEGGASVDAKDKYGWTALHSAAFYGAIEPLLLVLHRATNKAPRDNQGWTPLDLAAFYKHDEAVELLDPDNKVGTYAWARKSSTSEDEDEFTASSAPKDKAETYAWAQEGDSSGHKDDYSRWFRATRGQIFEAPGD